MLGSARRPAVVLALLGVGFGLVISETFFSHDFADLWVGPKLVAAVACVALAGLMDPDGRLRMSLRAVARTVAYLILVFGAGAVAYFIWFAANYKD